VIGALYIHDHWSSAPEKQDDLLALSWGRIDIPVNRTSGDVEKVSRLHGDHISSPGTPLEADSAGDHVAVDIMVSVVMPARDYAWIYARADYLEAVSGKRPMPGNARASCGVCQRVFSERADPSHAPSFGKR
jgi:hypothetical protein